MNGMSGKGRQPLLDHILAHVCVQYRLPEEKVITMLHSFITVLRNHMTSLETALAASDIEEIGRNGHALKGALLNLGLFDIAMLAEKIESATKEAGGRDFNYGELVVQIRQMLRDVL